MKLLAQLVVLQAHMENIQHAVSELQEEAETEETHVRLESINEQVLSIVYSIHSLGLRFEYESDLMALVESYLDR